MSSPVSRGASALRRFLGMRPKLVSRTLFGRPLRIVEGTVRTQPDYDDAWFLACALRSETIVDVGANRGDMALLSLLCPNVRQVVLIEPNPDALAIATENLVRNHLSAAARFVCAFVSDSGGSTARLWTVGPGAAGSMYTGHAETAARAGSSIDVPTVTLDGIVSSYGLVPDLVKIDVEGAERLVLAGAKQCSAHRRSRFLVEMHSNPELSMADNTTSVLSWCDELGYAAWYLARGSRLMGAAEVKDRGRCHLLLQPADWPYPPWLKDLPQSAALERAWDAARN